MNTVWIVDRCDYEPGPVRVYRTAESADRAISEFKEIDKQIAKAYEKYMKRPSEKTWTVIENLMAQNPFHHGDGEYTKFEFEVLS